MMFEMKREGNERKGVGIPQREAGEEVRREGQIG